MDGPLAGVSESGGRGNDSSRPRQGRPSRRGVSILLLCLERTRPHPTARICFGASPGDCKRGAGVIAGFGALYKAGAWNVDAWAAGSSTCRCPIPPSAAIRTTFAGLWLATKQHGAGIACPNGSSANGMVRRRRVVAELGVKRLGDPPPGIQDLVPDCAARRLWSSSRTVLGGKGSHSRAATRRALASCAPFCKSRIATGGSAGNQIRCGFVRRRDEGSRDNQERRLLWNYT
jgi:hypothetical protein